MLALGPLVIRIMQKEDIEPARLMHNAEDTLMWLSDVRHVSEEEQLRWFEKVSINSRTRRYAIRTTCGEFVGLFRLDDLDTVNGSACVGLDICRSQRGKGYAKQIYAYFFDYLYMELGLNRLSLVTLETNYVAIALYRKLGFVEEGCLREAIWRGGRHRNLILFSLLRAEYEASLNEQN